MKVIKLENVGKRFTINYKQDRKDNAFVPSSFSAQRIPIEFWALRDITFDVEKGAVVGVIGRNGAGKTTLLNIIAGITSPTRGKFEKSGRVSAMLTLGAGFQDELTGKENIYLNSSILGMSRGDVNKRFRSIAEYSELDGFLDSPLQTYSSGMRLRLGFSVAIHMDFDIFLIDEIIGVGDVSFQKKCFAKLEELKKQGKTMIIATQSLDMIERFCEEAFLLENGEIALKGHPQKVTARYLELLNESKLSETFQRRYGRIKWWADKTLWEKQEGSKEARIIEVKSYNSQGKETNLFKAGESATVKVNFIVENDILEPHFGVAIFREDGIYCYGPNTSFDGHHIQKINKGKGCFSIQYKSLILKPGTYRFSTAIWDKNEMWAYDYHVGYYKFEVRGDNNDSQLLNLRFNWEPPEGWWRKIKMLRLGKLDMLSNFNNQRQDKVSSSDIELLPAELLGNSNGTFNTGEDVKIRLRVKFLSKGRDYYLWAGLFRYDDIYCHGASRRLEEETVILTYPGIPMLTGDYYLSVCIFQKNQKEPLLYQRRAVSFRMFFPGEDHGTVYLEHSWEWMLP